MMKWATHISPAFFFIFYISLQLGAIECEVTISQFYCNNTWNPEIEACSKTFVKSLCNLNLQLSFIETDSNNKTTSPANGQQLTIELLVTSGFETLRATSIPGVDYWIVATLTTTDINLDNNDTYDVPLNQLKMQMPCSCGQTFMVARVKQPNNTTVDQSIPMQLKCLEKNVDLALYGENKDVYDMYSHRPVIPSTGQPISYFIPGFKLWIKNNMPNETFSSRTGPSVYVVSAYIKSQFYNMFQYSILNDSARTAAQLENGELDYELADVMLHKGNRLVPSHGGRGTPSMPSGYQVALELDELVLKSEKVCGNGLIVIKLSVPHSPADSNLANNYYLIPVFVDCWGQKTKEVVETCKVIPNYYDGGQTAWITYTIPGQTKIFEYKSKERTVRPVHVEMERANLQDVALMKLTTDVQSDRLQLIHQCVDTVSGGSDTFVASLEVLLSGVEKSWAEMKPENDIQKVEYDKFSLIFTTVSEVLTLALQLKHPLNGWLHIPFYLAFSSDGHIWEDENLATNQVSRRMKRGDDEFGDELEDNEVEEVENEEEELPEDGDESEGVEEYAYGVNGTTIDDGTVVKRRLRRAADGGSTISTTQRTTSSATQQQRSGVSGMVTEASTARTSARSTSPSSMRGSTESQVSRGESGRPVTTNVNEATTQGSTGSRTSNGVTTSRPAVQRGTSTTARYSQSGSTPRMSGGSSSTTPSATGNGAGATTSRMSTGQPVLGSRSTTTAPGTTRGGSSRSSGSTQKFARLEATSSTLGSSSTVRSRPGTMTTKFSETAPETSTSTSEALHSTIGTGPTSNAPTAASGSSGTTGRFSSTRTTVATSMESNSSTQVGTEGEIDLMTTTTSLSEPNDTPYFGKKPLWHQDVSKIIYGIIKYDSSFLRPYLAPDRIETISFFFQTLFYGRTEDLDKFSYIPKSTLNNMNSLLKMVLSSSLPRIFDDIPKPYYELIMKWYNSELVNKSSQVTGCTFRSGLELFLNATERMKMAREWQHRKDQMSLYGDILTTLLQDDHPEYMAELYTKIMAAWSGNDAWMIRDGIPIHEPDVDDVCKRYTAAKLWQLEMPPVSKFAGRTVSPDHYKSVFWTEDRGTIYRGDRCCLTGQVFWSKVATCSCAAGNACGTDGSPPSTTTIPSLAVASSSQWSDSTTASLQMTSGQTTRDDDMMSAAPVYRYHDEFQIKDQQRTYKRQEEEEFEIHEDLLFSD